MAERKREGGQRKEEGWAERRARVGVRILTLKLKIFNVGMGLF